MLDRQRSGGWLNVVQGWVEDSRIRGEESFVLYKRGERH